MTTLKLQGTLSYIDDRGRLKLIVDETTADKLRRHCGAGIIPIAYTAGLAEVTICPRPEVKNIAQFEEKIGSECSVVVKIRPYKFTSRLEKNAGDIISGVQIILLDI